MRAWVCTRLAPKNDRQTGPTCRGRMPRDGPLVTSTPSWLKDRRGGGRHTLPSLRRSDGPSVHSIHELHVLDYALQGHDFRMMSPGCALEPSRTSMACVARHRKSGTSIGRVGYDLHVRELDIPRCGLQPNERVGKIPRYTNLPLLSLLKAMEGRLRWHLGS